MLGEKRKEKENMTWAEEHLHNYRKLLLDNLQKADFSFAHFGLIRCEMFK